MCTLTTHKEKEEKGQGGRALRSSPRRSVYGFYGLAIYMILRVCVCYLFSCEQIHRQRHPRVVVQEDIWWVWVLGLPLGCWLVVRDWWLELSGCP